MIKNYVVYTPVNYFSNLSYIFTYFGNCKSEERFVESTLKSVPYSRKNDMVIRNANFGGKSFLISVTPL